MNYFITPAKVLIGFIAEDGSFIPAEPNSMFQGPDGSISNRETFADGLFNIKNAIDDAISNILNSNQQGVTPVNLVNEFKIVEPNYFTYKEQNIKKVVINLVFEYYYTVAKFKSHFDIETRGRILQKEMFNHLGMKTNIIVTSRP